LANPRVDLLHSKPGLPHQRNVGCAHIQRFQRPSTNPIVCFLDDDVLIDESYFENVIRLLSSKEFILGAWDANLRHRDPGVARIFLSKLGILTTHSFGISSAALTNVGPIDSDNHVVDWVPGHSFSMPLSIWQEHGFNESVRMTGEDLEFQFRASGFPKVMSKALSVRHARSPIGRFSAGSVAFSEALFRSYLARAYSDRFSRAKVLIGTLVTATYQIFTSPSSSMGSLRCAFLEIFSREKLVSTIQSAGYRLDAREKRQ
jgi:GT2 family glycosyltransferase